MKLRSLIARLWAMKSFKSCSVFDLMKFSASLSNNSVLSKLFRRSFEHPDKIIFTAETPWESNFFPSEVVSPPPYFRLLFFGVFSLSGHRSHKFFKCFHFFCFIKVTIKNMVPTRKCDILCYTFGCAPMFTKFTVKHRLRPLRPRTPTSSQVPW